MIACRMHVDLRWEACKLTGNAVIFASFNIF